MRRRRRRRPYPKRNPSSASPVPVVSFSSPPSAFRLALVNLSLSFEKRLLREKRRSREWSVRTPDTLLTDQVYDEIRKEEKEAYKCFPEGEEVYVRRCWFESFFFSFSFFSPSFLKEQKVYYLFLLRPGLSTGCSKPTKSSLPITPSLDLLT